MLYSGARVEEMFKIEAQHVNGDRITLPIKQSKGRRRSRVIYLPAEVVPIVAKYAAKYPTGKLFRNTKGKPWNKNSINCRFKRLKTVMNEPKLSATVLRHSFSAHRLAEGQDSLLVSKLLGHADGRMLATRYGHLDQQSDVLRKAANSVQKPGLA
jgi:integrase